MSAATSLPSSMLALPHGVHRDVPESLYHARERGLANKSAIDHFRRSPAHYAAWLAGLLDEDETPALAFGSAFHCATLEPARFATDYAVEPDFGDCRFKDAKAARDEWRKRNAGRTLVSARDFERISGMVRSLRAHPLGGKMIEDGDPELTLRWRDEESGVECKARADYYVRRHRMAVDVKTATDASPEAFARAVVNYGYHRQEAFYRAGLAAVGEAVEHFVFLVVEKDPPYAVAIYALDEDARLVGRRQVVDDLARFASCLEADKWPSYGDGIQVLRLPPWAAMT